MRRFGKLAVTAGAAAAMVGLSAGSAAASPVTPRAEITGGVIAAGYFAVPKPGGAPSFIHIQDTFTVPAVNCSQVPNGIAQERAGMDGLMDSTIERVGVAEQCSGGVQQAPRAWFQMYPAAAKFLFNPSPGDLLNTSVTYTGGGHYTFVVNDVTTSKTYTGTAKCTAPGGCHNSSAQVTAGPKTGTPLADFGSVDFQGIIATDSANMSGGLSNPNWNTVSLSDPFRPGAVQGPLNTLPGPPPHSEFVDTWVP